MLPGISAKKKWEVNWYILNDESFLYENIITSHETLVSAFCLKKIKDDQVFGIIFVVFSIMSWL